MISLSDYDYVLPPSLIANSPVTPRDQCKLLTLDQKTNQICHQHFYDLLNLLNQNDILVLNQTKVFPARLIGKKSTGGKIEILLLESLSQFTWRAIARPGLKKNISIIFDNDLFGIVLEFYPDTGEVDIEFNQNYQKLLITIDKIGHTPLPPYINPTQTEKLIRKNYQTVYANSLGSAAAPTAGMHFTNKLLNQLKSKKIKIEYLTLHVGLGTFQPLRPDSILSNKLHLEHYQISKSTAIRLDKYKKAGKRIIAVGTTTTRALESYAKTNQLSGTTDLFIYPPYNFKIVDSLITNFHLPKSSLLMLVTALAGYSTFEDSPLYQSYQQAIKNNYRFFSFGDAMWIY